MSRIWYDYIHNEGILIFDPYQATQTIQVEIVDDNIYENFEQFFVSLTDSVNAEISDRFAIGSIVDDEVLPRVSVDDVTLDEGNTIAQFGVHLSAPSSFPITVDYHTTDGTASSGVDYFEVSGTLNFAPGELSHTVNVPILGDVFDEFDESFSFNLSNPTESQILDGEGLGTIVDDDLTPEITITNLTVLEGDSGNNQGSVTVDLSAPSNLPITVDYQKVHEGEVVESKTLSFAPRETQKTIIVPFIGDNIDEADEVFTFNLSQATNATITDNQGVVTIQDDDLPPQLIVNNTTILEGDNGTQVAHLEVSLTNPSSFPITVDYDTPEITAQPGEDYLPVGGTRTFAPGETTQTISVRVIGDTVDEVDETFGFELFNPTNVRLPHSQVVVTITDDDKLLDTPIILTEGDDFHSSYSQPLTIPEASAQISFTLADLNFDATNPNFINDALEAVLVDDQGNSLVHTLGGGRNAFFNLSEGQPPQLASGVSFDGSTVKVNVTDVVPGTAANLIVRLVNGDGDTQTRVTLTEIDIVTGDGVGAPAIIPPGETSPNLALDFDLLEDVTPSIQPEYGATSFNDQTQVLTVDVALENLGSYGVSAPLLVAIDHLSDPSIQVLNADGFTPGGLPYYDFSHLVEGNNLKPGQSSQEGTISLSNSSLEQFTYDLVVLSALNVSPVITSQAGGEVVAGKSYTYEVTAEDGNGDDLTYSLLAAPQGMTIDPDTGEIKWRTDSNDIANHTVVVEVNDGQGGTQEQSFTVSVIEAPPNRPPVFTTTPVVDAFINQPYTYDSDGFDADVDSLTYRLLQAPRGMNINWNTGEINWTPDTFSYEPGELLVEVQVRDHKGATAVQSYNLNLWSDPNNTAPIFTSTPAIRHGLNQDYYQYHLEALDADGDTLEYRLVDGPDGASVDGDTGELLWSGESATAGENYDFTVEVIDGRGGLDTQTFSVEAYSALGTIRGAVFDDLDNNGEPGQTLVQGEDSSILFVVDVSGSVGENNIDWTTADIETLAGEQMSILEMEIAAAIVLSEQLILQGRGDTAQIGILSFDTNASALDLDPVTPGVQPFNTPLADLNNNGITDLREVFNTLSNNSSTIFNVALRESAALLNSLTQEANLIFFSDGGGSVDPENVETLNNLGVNITAFGIGSNARMSSIREIDPDAVQVTNPQQILDIFSYKDPRYIAEPLMENVTVYLDLNENGELDGDEPWQLTKPDDAPSALGNAPFPFSFENLLPDTYTLRQVVPDGYNQTAPNDAFIDTITVTGGETFYHLFGNHTPDPPPNQEPVFTTTDTSHGELLIIGERFTYQSLATDSNPDPLTYELTLHPEGMTIDSETGLVAWKPQSGQGGTHNVIIRVTDGQGGFDLQYFTLEVEPDNYAPMFTKDFKSLVPPQLGKPFEFQVRATDPDGDPLTYSLRDAPEGITIDGTTGVLKGIFTSYEETFTLNLTASDGKGGEVTKTTTVGIIPPLVNTAPNLTTEEVVEETGTIPINPRTKITIGSPYLYQLPTTDTDGDPLTYTLDNGPQGMVLNSERTLVWTPTPDQFGSQTIAITVDDGQGGTGSLDWDVEVLQPSLNQETGNFEPLNHAPQILTLPASSTTLDRLYQVPMVGYDPDGDLLLWSLNSAPEGMVIDPGTGSLSWQPTANQIGDHNVVVALQDHLGLETTTEFNLQVRGGNTPPQIISPPPTQLGLGQPYSYQIIANDVDNDELTFTLGIHPEGVEISTDGTLSWTPTPDQVGSHDVEVIVKDSLGNGNGQVYTLVVQSGQVNQAPTIISSPYPDYQRAEVGTPYTYQMEVTDPDGDGLNYELIESPEGMEIDNQGQISWSNPTLGEHTVIVGVDDGFTRALQKFDIQGIQNLEPVISAAANPPTTVFPGELYSYDVVAFDPNGDRLTYTLDSASQDLGMTIDERGRLRWTPSQEVAGLNHTVRIEIADESGATVSQDFEVRVENDTVAPQIDLVTSDIYINPEGGYEADLNSRVKFRVSATDNVGVTGTQLFINGNPVALDAYGVAFVEVTSFDNLQATAVAFDGAGNQASASSEVVVLDPSDPNAPDIDFDLSALENGVVSAPTAITGFIEDANLDYYVMEVRPTASNAPWREMFRGTTNVSNGTLGTFDPTLLANGSYEVRLTAYDDNGRSASLADQIEVAGDLKLGNFQLSFTDLSVPVAGIPISVTRTYDSLNANTTDDFGYGWRLEFGDTNLQTSLGYDEQLELTDIPSKGFQPGDKVYITVPGGERESFTYEPVLRPDIEKKLRGGFPIPDNARFHHPAFTADDPNSGLTLSVEPIDLIPRKATGQFFNATGIPHNPAFIEFGGTYTLTTDEGIVYKIDARSGDLLSLKDNNDNTLFFSEAGIESSTGVGITFERDAQGRISSVVDPEGNRVNYEYDAQGDLVAVTDRENNTTKFDYHDERDHYLEEIIDPLGRSGVKTEYNEDGRLSRIIDVNGEAVELVYDQNNSAQTIADVFGNKTEYVYDERGNILTEVNAVGLKTQRTYDDNNNLLSETIISNESGSQGWTTTYTYDEDGNQLTETDALGNVTRYTYNRFNKVLTETNALGFTTTNTYDSRGNLLAQTNAEGETTQRVYDSKGNITSLIDGEGRETKFEYDSFSQLIRKIDALGNETTYSYEPDGTLSGETTTVTSAEGSQEQTTTWTYDAEGNVISQNLPSGRIIQYEYDALGNQIASFEVGVNNPRRTEYEYDEKGQLIKTLYFDGTSESFIYDEAGREIATIDAAGNTTHFVRDALGRVVETIYPDNTPDNLSDNPKRQVTYDQTGRMVAIIDELIALNMNMMPSIGSFWCVMP